MDARPAADGVELVPPFSVMVPLVNAATAANAARMPSTLAWFNF